jgi:hypothetical protein
MEQRHKEQDEKMQVGIERRLAVRISKIAQTGALPEVPLDPISSPSARKSSCASTEVAPGACIEVAPGACTEGPEEPRAIEGVPVDDNQQYPMDFLYRCCTSHSATSQCRWRTEVLLRIFLDRLPQHVDSTRLCLGFCGGDLSVTI